ncbi:hypothetical protein GGR88_000305 [Sphingomonas jejuensis]|uniref:Tip attachment protein J domain-containing protein n=1 Tax=Sphingomonas jejuensis TaxID=904715 RepID=A0ABX0XHM3_9SPHN|nr:phage tail protein [Sphingomonas jejuensis]NJC32831.1 hypothetical protein [Sphingomonas jejuensis]
MATLVLTSVGTLIGGPLGGAIGAVLGQSVDAAILQPKGRQGPRLTDLTVQTSSYGTAIPALFGTIRAAGTVIWSTDLREERTRTGGGKGRPSVTNYSYSASFAVLLSARRVRAVRRVWADGNLMRGAGGDWKVATGFRLHHGDEDQEVDPLIAAAEGAGRTPAHRGSAYAVFENLDLGPYGNRIPSLTFEIVADEEGAAVSTIVAEASAGDATAATDRRFVGFATGGDSVRGLIETIMAAVPLSPRDESGTIVLRPASEPVAVIDADERIDGRIGRSDGIDADVPGELTVGYHDPERDYQAGLQRARWLEGGRRAERIDLAAVIAAGSAKAIAHDRLERLWMERGRLRLSLPWRRIDLTPGDCVTLADVPGRWRIVGWTLEEMRVELELVRTRGTAQPTSLAASPGRSVSAVDLPHGETRLVVLEPRTGIARADGAPQLSIAAAGAAGWRSAGLLLSVDGGQSFDPAGSTAAPAVIGTVGDPLPPAATAIRDDRTAIEVVLPHAGMVLHDMDDAGLSAGRNLAAVGEEIIQFGRAEPLGQGRWRLSRLLRGRRGTEDAVKRHGAGEAFVLLEPGATATVLLPPAAAGGSAIVIASGPGDPPDGVRAARSDVGSALRPPAPCHLVLRPDEAGAWLGWTRRSRADWDWRDGVDASLGEAIERYRITIEAAGETRIVETGEPRLHVHTQTLSMGASFAVQQVGDWGLSGRTVLQVGNLGGMHG